MAGDESYILKVRVATPLDLEDLLARIRAAANVSTRTTIVLSTPYEGRAVTGARGESPAGRGNPDLSGDATGLTSGGFD